MIRFLPISILILVCQLFIVALAGHLVRDGYWPAALIVCYCFGFYMSAQYTKVHPNIDDSAVYFRLEEGRAAFLAHRLVILPVAMVPFASIMILWAMQARSRK